MKKASFSWSVSSLWIIFVGTKWDENCFRDCQFATHLYERCFSAIEAVPFLLLCFRWVKKATRLETRIGGFTAEQVWNGKRCLNTPVYSCKTLDNFYLFCVSNEAPLCFPDIRSIVCFLSLFVCDAKNSSLEH